jgi:urea carboxylase
VAAVEAGTFTPKIAPVTFDLDAFNRDIDGYNHKLEALINGD